MHPEELSLRWLVRPDDPIFFHEREVYLEITESAAFTHYDLCMSVLKDVCARGRVHATRRRRRGQQGPAHRGRRER